MLLAQPQLGFSITSAFKKVGGLAVKTVTVPTKYAYKGTKLVAKTAYKGVEWTVIKPTMWLAEHAMAPVKHRVQKIVQRRAVKLAWDRRKSKTPTLAEHNEARAWTKSKLRGELPHGPVLAVFAGPPAVLDSYLGNGYQLGIAPALVAAAVPVLVAAVQSLLNRYSSSGEAPADPGADAAAAAAAPDMAVAPGEVDMTPVQDAAQAANDAVQDATTPRGSKHIKGIGNIKQSHLLIGGAVVGAIVLVMVLKKKD